MCSAQFRTVPRVLQITHKLVIMTNQSSTSSRRFEETDHADLYLKFRPDWPQNIIKRCLDFLHEKKAKPFQFAVDVGCGSGQNTRPLAPHFEKVIGVDVSEAQILAAQRAEKPSNVEFRTGRGESIPVPDSSVDLITCAEAVHWFDLEAFFREVDRILKPTGCVAIYAYSKIQPWVDSDDDKNEQVHQIITELHRQTLGPYTSDCSRHLRNMLADVHIPYEETIRDHTIEIRQDTTMTSYTGYMRSWSSYQGYLEKNPDGPDPLVEVQERLMGILGLDAPAEKAKIRIRSPVVLLLGRKPEKEASSQ